MDPHRPRGTTRLGARTVVILSALLCGAAWFVTTAGTGTTSAGTPLAGARPAQGKDPNPNDLSTGCIPGAEQVRWGSDRDDRALKDLAHGDIICARKGNDTITVRYFDTKVWAGPGHDTIRMKNRKVNELRAGTGRDSARTDPLSTDTWYADLERYSTASVAPSRRAGAAAWRYPAREPRIQCVIEEGQRRLHMDPPPEMRAVDRTGRVDWQFVAWSPVLTWWDGDSWEFVIQNEWLWDRTYDEGVASSMPNVWRRYSSGQKWRLWFYANRPGFFRVAAYYFHYAADGVPENRVYDWVDQHRGQFAAQHGQWCHFTT